MAGGKETPRQKMIGMMYLVLTALLALNVSKEIINAFVKLDQKLMESNALFLSESDEIMMEFENAMVLKQNKKSVKPIYEKALKVRTMAFEVDKFINIDCKNELIKEVENTDWITVDEKNQRFNTRNPMEIETKDDYDVATRLFGGESGTDGFERGAEIRNRIHNFRDELLSFITEFDYAGKKYKFNPSKIDNTDSNSIARTLDIELKKNVYEKDRDKVKAIYKLLTLPENLKDNEDLVPWQFGTFDHAPIVAASAMFTALSNDIRNAEMKALELLRSKISPEIVKVNKVDILASARTNYINMGDSLDLNVMMAAYDTTDIAIIKYGIDADTLNESSWKEMRGKIKLNGSQSGVHHVKGVMGIREKGVLTWKPWRFKYEVGQPMAIISNSELNILYADWDNKIEATASGYSSENIVLSGSSGMQRKGDYYVIKPSKTLVGSKITLNVSGKNADGSMRALGKKEFKVRKMPIPMVFVGTANNLTQGSVDKVKLLQGGFVTAAYDPNSVVLDAKFTVTKFKMTISKDGVFKEYFGTGNKLTPAMTNIIGALPSKSSITFSDIVISGPNNSVLAGPTAAFTLK